MRITRRHAVLWTLLLACALAVPAAGAGASEQLGPFAYSRGVRLVQQADGRLVAVGTTSTCPAYAPDPTCGRTVLLLARFLRNGQPDRSYGGGDGLATLSVLDDSSETIEVRDAALTPNGKLVVGAQLEYCLEPAPPGASLSCEKFALKLLLVRLHRDGSLDSSFGANGIVLSDFGDNYRFNAIAIQPDGRVLVAGWIYSAVTGPDFAVARFTSSGDLDPTFGGDGLVTTPVGPGRSSDAAQAVAVQADGRIVVAGGPDCSTGCFSNSGFAVVRYLQDGTPDPSFGVAGVGQIGFASSPEAWAQRILLQGDGRILVGGATDFTRYTHSAPRSGIVRYLPDGTLDPSFGGGDGEVKSADCHSTDLLVAPDPSSLLLGSPGRFHRTCLARFNDNGDIVNVTAAHGLPRPAVFTRPAIYANGRVVGIGSAQPSSNRSLFALLSLKPSGVPDRRFGTNGIALAPELRPETRLRGLRYHPAPLIHTSRSRIRVTFGFRSTVMGATFTCRLDKGPFRPCTSPKSWRVRPGVHTARFRSHAYGRREASPATFTFRVVRATRP